MFVEIHNNIVNITDDDHLNTQNYISSLKHIQNLHLFLSELRNTMISKSKHEFLPSYRASELVNSKSILYTDIKETELKVFKIKCKDKKIIENFTDIKNIMCNHLCSDVVLEYDIMRFYLK